MITTRSKPVAAVKFFDNTRCVDRTCPVYTHDRATVPSYPSVALPQRGMVVTELESSR